MLDKMETTIRKIGVILGTTIVYWGHIRIMLDRMETTIYYYWGYMFGSDLSQLWVTVRGTSSASTFQPEL